MATNHAEATHPAGHILTLGPNVAHDVEGGETEDSVFLLTIAWPAGGSEAPTERGGTGA